MLHLFFALSVLFTVSAFGATATCKGKVQGKRLFFKAQGSVTRMEDGNGIVKINGKTVAHFDGEAAKVDYLRRKFSIRNQRGDVVEGKLHNIRTGASTLTKMVLPGEGITMFNVPVTCSMR
jgi:hypothetical protein